MKNLFLRHFCHPFVLKIICYNLKNVLLTWDSPEITPIYRKKSMNGHQFSLIIQEKTTYCLKKQ